MPNIEKTAKLLRISRLLTPDNKAQLLTMVQVAYVAENSTRKAQSQEYSCRTRKSEEI